MVRISKILVFSLAIVAFSVVSTAYGQGLGDLGGDLGGNIGGDLGGGDLNQQDLSDQIFDAVEQGGGPANTTGNTIGNTGGGAGGIGTPAENSTFDMEVEVAEDQRNSRGFVGISLIDSDEALEFKFVGPRAGDTAGASARTPTNFGRGGGGFGGGSNVTSGVFVNRGNPVRTRLVPRFQARQVSPIATASRFNSRLQSLPINQNSRNSMRVVMQGNTAVIRGNAQNREQMMKIARQLRLEPGVSRIVSQVSINP
jgi:hypothetical protein